MNISLFRGFIATGMALLLSAPLVAAASSPQVKTQFGIVEGKEDGAVAAFLGIPYAQPPVGDLRWKPPVPAAKWSGVRKTVDFGAHCLQGPERVGSGETPVRQASRHGLDLWRRLCCGCDIGSPTGWNAACTT